MPLGNNVLLKDNKFPLEYEVVKVFFKNDINVNHLNILRTSPAPPPPSFLFLSWVAKSFFSVSGVETGCGSIERSVSSNSMEPKTHRIRKDKQNSGEAKSQTQTKVSIRAIRNRLSHWQPYNLQFSSQDLN